MADDTAALVISLEAKIDKFIKAMNDVGAKVDATTKQIEDRFTHAMQAVNDKIGSVAQGFVTDIGLMGTVLARLGPAGFAAAVGLGAVAAAFNATADAAARSVERAKALKEFSLVTGFSIEDASGIRKAFAAVGADVDQAQKSTEMFTVSLAELRRTGTGPLADALKQVDIRLVGQMLQTKDTAEAAKLYLNVLSQLNTEERNRAARQVGGRGGIETFGLAAADLKTFTAEWEKQAKAAKGQAEQVDALVKLGREHERLLKEQKSAWDALFPVNAFLENQNRLMTETTRIMKEIKRIGVVETIKRDPLLLSAASGGVPMGDFDPKDTAKRSLAQGLRDQNELAAAMKATSEAGKEWRTVQDQATTATVVMSDAMKKNIQLRADERAKVLEDKTALEDLSKIAPLRPEQASRLRQLAIREQELAPDITSPARQAQVTKGIQENTDAVQANKIAIQERLGVASEADILAVKQADIAKQLADKQIDATQAVAAAYNAARESKKRFNEEQVKNSDFPGLTRFAQDARDFKKNMDGFVVGTLNNFENAAADFVVHTRKIGQAFDKLIQAIATDIVKLAIRAAITGPLAGNLNSLFGSLSGKAAGGPVAAGSAYVVGEKGPELFVPNSSGTIVPGRAASGSGVPQISIGDTTLVVQGDVGPREVEEIKRVLASHEKRIDAQTRAFASAQRLSTYGVR